jgi:hypothetical protein
MERDKSKGKIPDRRELQIQILTKTRLTSRSAMYHIKLPPSTDIWVCEHEVGYPDICEECPRRKPGNMARQGWRFVYTGLFSQETAKRVK